MQPKKAVDTCDHDILLQKMSNICIRSIELAWFSNNLKGRQHPLFPVSLVIVKTLEGGEIWGRPPNFVTQKKNIFEAQAVSKAKMTLTNA